MASCKRCHLGIVVALIAATIFLCHCSVKRQFRILERFNVPIEDEAKAAFDALRARNEKIASIKGIGTIQWRQKGILQKLRGAWLGNMPNQLRLELLGFSGQPIAGLASNGSWNYFLWYADDRLIKRKSDRDDLKRFLSIPISIEDLVHFMCGRLPVQAGGSGWIERAPDGSEFRLVYKEAGARWFYRIYFDNLVDQIHKVERLSDKGEVIMRATFNSYIEKGGYHFPSIITITNNGDAEFVVNLDRIWVNPTVTADKFELIPKN